VRVNSGRLALALVGLLVAAGGAFAIGRATATDSEPAAAVGAKAIVVPKGSADVPSLREVGSVPDLRAAPSSGGGAAPSPGSGSTPVAPSQPLPSEPAPTQPAPSEPAPSEPDPVEPPPPPPPGAG
jgi:hypothetical protein